jgi:hypothetical protein
MVQQSILQRSLRLGWSPRLLSEFLRHDPAINFVLEQERCFAPEEF